MWQVWNYWCRTDSLCIRNLCDFFWRIIWQVRACVCMFSVIPMSYLFSSLIHPTPRPHRNRSNSLAHSTVSNSEHTSTYQERRALPLDLNGIITVWAQSCRQKDTMCWLQCPQVIWFWNLPIFHVNNFVIMAITGSGYKCLSYVF